METTKDDPAVAELARSLDCFTEADLCRLAGAKPTTVEAWRKRHTGPDYVLIGNAFLYPRESLKEFLRSRVRKMGGSVSAKSVL
ncbi:MAG: helix-turn-helix domain-containing protein [Rubrivivax sp.]|nr:helix-turn-helix domain-containing protein [Rubrivivax sp.]